MSELSERIAYELDCRGLKRSDLVRMTGINEATIRNWEKTEPKATMLLKVADALNLSVEYLLTGNEEEKVHYGVNLTEEEIELITRFRAISIHDKTMVKLLIDQAYLSLQKDLSSVG